MAGVSAPSSSGLYGQALVSPPLVLQRASQERDQRWTQPRVPQPGRARAQAPKVGHTP